MLGLDMVIKIAFHREKSFFCNKDEAVSVLTATQITTDKRLKVVKERYLIDTEIPQLNNERLDVGRNAQTDNF